MRGRCLLPTAIASILACGVGRAAAAQPTPDSRVLRNGALVRVQLTSDSLVVGRLVVPFGADSARVTICAEELTCTRVEDVGARTIPVREIRSLQVRGRGTGVLGYLGLYLGMFVGQLYHGSPREPNGAGMLVGGVGGLALGGLLGSRTTTWLPIIPCIHTCGWGFETSP